MNDSTSKRNVGMLSSVSVGGSKPEEKMEQGYDEKSLNFVLLRFSSSETSFHKHLKTFKEKFLDPMVNFTIVEEAELEKMFPCLKRMIEMSAQLQNGLDRLPSIPDKLSTLLSLFSLSYISLFSSYTASYLHAEKFLQKSRNESSKLDSFINIQQRVTQINIDHITRIPIDRVRAYCDILRSVMALTPADHPRAAELSYLLQEWVMINESIDKMLKKKKNEEKLTAIELLFPEDDLALVHRDEEEARKDSSSSFRFGKPKKRLSTPSSIFKIGKEDSKSARSSSASKSVSKRNSFASDFSICPPDEDFSRCFVKECPVIVFKDGSYKNRYMFIFNDMAVFAKARPNSTYKAKLVVNYALAWVHAADGELPRKHGFIFGTPSDRTMALYTRSSQERLELLEMLTRGVISCKRALQGCEGQISIYPFIPEKIPRADGLPSIEKITLNLGNTSEDLVRMTIEQMGVNVNPEAHTVWELSRDTIAPLKPYECPLALFKHGQNGGHYDAFCQFVLRQTASIPLTVEMLPPNLRMLMQPPALPPSPKSPRKSIIRGWHTLTRKDKSPRKSPKPETNAQQAMKPNATLLPPENTNSNGKLLKRSLKEIMPDGILPNSIKDMVLKLYLEGPACDGIFRKSANSRITKQILERLDAGLPVNMHTVSIINIACIFKELLRSLKDSLFPLIFYTELVSTNGIMNDEIRIEKIRRVLERFPSENFLVASYVIATLHHIAEFEQDNSMNAKNLGICVGQSLLWPAAAEDVIKNEVPPFIEFLVINVEEIFGPVDLAEMHYSSDSVDPSEVTSDIASDLNSSKFSGDTDSILIDDMLPSPRPSLPSFPQSSFHDYDATTSDDLRSPSPSTPNNTMFFTPQQSLSPLTPRRDVKPGDLSFIDIPMISPNSPSVFSISSKTPTSPPQPDPEIRSHTSVKSNGSKELLEALRRENKTRLDSTFSSLPPPPSLTLTSSDDLIGQRLLSNSFDSIEDIALPPRRRTPIQLEENLHIPLASPLSDQQSDDGHLKTGTLSRKRAVSAPIAFIDDIVATDSSQDEDDDEDHEDEDEEYDDEEDDYDDDDDETDGGFSPPSRSLPRRSKGRVLQLELNSSIPEEEMEFV